MAYTNPLDPASKPKVIPFIGLRMGEGMPGRFEVWKGYAMEKAKRLGRLPEHFSSWQSRDEAMNQFGGAIRVMGGILSFSGLAEHYDEMAMLISARELDLVGDGYDDKIIAISDNARYREYK